MAGIYPFINYRVFFTPLVAENVYGSTIDVTQDVDLTDFIKDFGTIKREVDNGDYDIGIFTFGDITISAINFSRKFNEPEDPRSMFKYRRDRCKVEIIFFDRDGSSSTRFKGLLNDDATRLDFISGIIRFKILSLDSIFRQLQVPPGAVVAGDLFSTAIKKILNVPEVTTTLNYSASNVVLDLDLVIDTGEVFSGISSKDALDRLLLASNSILMIDNTDTIHVKARTESANVFYLYGHGDLYGRENILQVKEYNNGLHRSFSSVKVGDNAIATDAGWVAEYGFRQKEIDFDFITTRAKQEQIAKKILAAFSAPKTELEITVLTRDVPDIELLDVVSVDYNYRIVPSGTDESVPMWNTALWGDFYWPRTTGTFRIKSKIKFKVIGINEDPIKFTTDLKLRQVGTTRSDGYF